CFHLKFFDSFILFYVSTIVTVPSSGDVVCSDSACAGSCDEPNGCICSKDVTLSCIPSGAECPSPYSNCCPLGLFWSTTESCCSTTIYCNPPCQADEECENISNIATCNCNTTVYAGISTSAVLPTVKCESDTITVSFKKCLLYSLGFDPDSLALSDSSENCSFPYRSLENGIRYVSLQGEPKTGWCGNNVNTDSSKVYFSNTLHIGIRNKTIITVNPVNVSFTCSYNLTMQTSLAAAIHPVLSSVNLTVDGEGSFVTTMSAYWDPAYSDAIESTDEVVVGKAFYLGVFSESSDASIFVLRVENCFGTPDGDANNVNKAHLVIGGCPANKEVDVDVQENGVSLQARIKVNSFIFEGQAQVFITCTVRLCPKNGTCTGCTSQRSSENEGTGSLTIPVNINSDYYSSAANTVSSWSLLTCSLLTFLAIKNL
uniref:ZP domain-containing protein n=1 Tax=Leptobrachium leishanense TaxID=445787 RepID=A0A8C5M8N2_9ANUR